MQKHLKILTGFSFFDQKWGGAYPGGNYFIFGSKKSGKTILALNIIEHLAQSNFNILYLTSERKKSLEIQASSVYFDIDEAISGGVLKVERIDSNLSQLEELKSLITSSNPSILVVDELINNNLIPLRNDYLELIEFLEESDITSFFIASVPNDENSKQFVRKVAKISTAVIQLQKSSNKRNYSGTVTLKPNIGHFEGEFDTTFKIEPIKGFITLADNEKSIYDMLSNADHSDLFGRKQEFEYSNLYDVDEFKFLLDTKIAMANQTGEKINLISYKLLNNSISISEISNSLKNILDKGDKICFTEKMIYILPVDDINPSVQELATNLDKEISKQFINLGGMELNIKKTIQLLKPNFKII